MKVIQTKLVASVPLLILLAISSLGQQKPDSKGPGDTFRGFTMSPTEHVINKVDMPFRVRSVEGIVLDPTDIGLPGVLVEIRGPGDKKVIYKTVTAKNGHYRFSHVREGTYAFKTTLNGYQSEYGTIVVSKSANPDARVNLKPHVGD